MVYWEVVYDLFMVSLWFVYDGVYGLFMVYGFGEGVFVICFGAVFTISAKQKS